MTPVTSTSEVTPLVQQPQFSVGVGEVVAVYVARWEKMLKEKRSSLSEQIKKAKQLLNDLDKGIIGTLNQDEFNKEFPSPFNFVGKVRNVEVNWNRNWDRAANTLNFTVEFCRGQKVLSSYQDYVAIPQLYVTRHEELEQEIKELSSQLTQVMMEMKSISSKERELKAKLLEQQLEQAGWGGILKDERLLQMVEVFNPTNLLTE